MKNFLYFLALAGLATGGVIAYGRHERTRLNVDASRKFLLLAQEVGRDDITLDQIYQKIQLLRTKEVRVLDELFSFMIAHRKDIEAPKLPKELRSDVDLYLMPLFATEQWQPFVELFGT